jgi:hypothetical protein
VWKVVGLTVDGLTCLCLVVLPIVFIKQTHSFETVVDIHAEQLGRGVQWHTEGGGVSNPPKF